MQRIVTKEDRIKARYIPDGITEYRRDHNAVVYADITPSGNSDHTFYRAIGFVGSAMKSSFFHHFRTDQEMKKFIDDFFKRQEEIQQWKASRKENRDKGETDTQKVKKALKAAGYPVTSVTRGTGTASNWINVKIDDYESKINEHGRMVSQQGAAYSIVKHSAGRDDCHDDTQTDYFCENIIVNFTKYHRCSECVISDCKEWHTPESAARGCFLSREMADLQYAESAAWTAEQNRKKEEIAREPIGIEIRGDKVKVRNRAVNCGACFFIPRDRYDQLIQAGKTKVDIFDLLAFEDTEREKAEAYHDECEANREKIGHPWKYHQDGTRDNAAGPSSLDPVKLPHEVKEIMIDMDGTKKGKKYFDSFPAASAYLMTQEATFPSTGGYDKLNFKIVFVDGEDYSGRLDVKSASCPDNDLDLLDHVLTHCEWYAGRAKNPYCGPEKYAEMVKGFTEEKKKACADFIDKYLLPVKPDVPTFEICRGCPEYAECQGGHPEDCEQGYLDIVRSEMPSIWVKV